MAEQHSDNQIEKILTESRFRFAIKCLYTIMQRKENKNIVFSPYSIYEGLLLVYLASSGDTEKHLRDKLELPDHVNIQKDITDWISHSKTKKRMEDKKLPNYNDENSCWITSTKCVNNMTQSLFKDKLDVIGFHRTFFHFYLKKRINKLLRKKTEGYIRKPVEINNINEKMEIILLTVLCLQDDTVKGIITTDEMHSLKKPRTVVYPKLKTIVTELPFVDKNLSLFVLFPACQYMDCHEWLECGKMSELVERFQIISTTKEGIDDFRRLLDGQQSSAEKFKTKGRIIYPNIFEQENEFEIDKLLNELGIQNLLEPDKAILSNFTDQNLHLGDAMHRAYIKVTPKIVTAGAINMFFTKKGGLFNPPEDIDHSVGTKKFLWLLYCKESHTILFIGSINEEKPFLPPIIERRGFFDRIRQTFDY